MMKNRLPAFSAVFLGAVVAAGLMGCVSGRVPENPSTPWNPPLTAQSPDMIWQDVRARRSGWTNRLSLAAALDVALANNPTTRALWHEARAASAQVDQARGNFLPTIVGSAGVSRQRTETQPETFFRDSLRYGPGLQLNYLVINFGGGHSAAVQQALQTVYAANYRFNRAIQEVLRDVASAYYGMISATAAVTAAEATLSDARAAWEAARARQSSGVGTELDVLLAQAGYDQARYDLVNYRGLLKIAQAVLARALGLPADANLEVVMPTDDVPAAVAPQDMRQLIDQALARRPDMAALRAKLSAKRAAERVAGAVLWPSLYLAGNVSRNYYDTETAKEFFLTQDSDWSYGAGLTLQWTLFDGLQDLSARRAAAAQADAIREELLQAELAASAEVWSNYYTYETALERHAVSAAYLKSAAKAHDLALASYRNGLSSITELLNAESALAQARARQITARQDAFTALVNLALATGCLEKGSAAEQQAVFLTPTGKDQP
ncbi:MAG: TolC family protein [Lentisphaerae bacterium]|nr:TolC family protein [Lentisphaerota bacterium]